MTPLVGAGFGGVVSTASSTVVWSLRLWRRFWPLSLITRSRSAAGLKSTPKFVPYNGIVSCDTFVTTTSTVSGGVLIV